MVRIDFRHANKTGIRKGYGHIGIALQKAGYRKHVLRKVKWNFNQSPIDHLYHGGGSGWIRA